MDKMENKKLRIALRLAVEHIACYSDTCYYCDDNWRSKCKCVDNYCSDDCLKLIETCLLNEADELIRKEDIQTCRMFDITMDELKSSNSKEVCYACGYDTEDLVKEIAELEEKLKNKPKFNVGDKVYLINDDEEVESDFIESIEIDNSGIEYYTIMYGVCWYEEELFKTKEEAKAKLKEIIKK